MMFVYGSSLVLVVLFTCFTLTQQQGERLTPPSGWRGPTPVLYRSSDSPSGITLREASGGQGRPTLVSGKIGNAVRLDASQRQWIDLGIHTEVCLTRPDRCTIGGAVSFWIKLIGTETYTGLLSTKESSGDIRVFTVVKTFNHIETNFFVQGANFHNFALRPDGDEWFHIVINYFGSGEGLGFVTYINGEPDHSERDRVTVPTGEGNGRIVIGRLYTETNSEYSSMEIDHLAFFNNYLTGDDIKLLRDV